MASRGIRISPEFELGSHQLLLEFAKINLGIACVTKEFSQEYLNSGLLYEVQLNEEIPKRSIGVCFLKGVSLSIASTKFIEIMESKEVDPNILGGEHG
jgi:DNA-binding transcriptional LysR family regulator